MYQLEGSEICKANHFFEKYDCNQAIIYSVFEGQFDGCVYVDDIGDIHWAVLRTPFLQHFIAGQPTDGCSEALEHILFHTILAEQDEKEIIIFSDSDVWHDILGEIFQKHKGITAFRKIFAFSREAFTKVQRPCLSADVQAVLEKGRNVPASHTDAWSVKLLYNDQIVSQCNVIMAGKSMAEIGISTEEAFQGKGYATQAAVLLIDQLLKDGLTPSWTTWPYRTASQRVALKLGFIPQPDAKAWIWMEGM